MLYRCCRSPNFSSQSACAASPVLARGASSGVLHFVSRFRGVLRPAWLRETWICLGEVVGRDIWGPHAHRRDVSAERVDCIGCCGCCKTSDMLPPWGKPVGPCLARFDTEVSADSPLLEQSRFPASPGPHGLSPSGGSSVGGTPARGNRSQVGDHGVAAIVVGGKVAAGGSS